MRSRVMLFSFVALALLTAVAHAQDAKATKKTIKAEDGVNLVCEVRGKGDTALIFLHGWCGERDYWKNQVKEFAPDYRIVTLDQAGHGESGKNRKEWTIASLAGDVESIVKDLKLKRVILIGHSMGGPVSLLAAKRLPGTVVAVIGVDTLQNAEAKIPEEMRKKFVESFEKDFKGTIQGGFGMMLNAKADADLKDWLVSRAAAQDPKMAIPLMNNLQDLDTKVLMTEAKVPVRCINSAGGYAFFRPTDNKVNKKYADFDAVMIDAVGHYPMLEKPAEFNEKLREVLKEFAVKK
jgi:pimeloyl-ACP methyl ester carboxylesterase